MKFLFSRDLRDQPHIRLALIFFVFSLLCFWGLNWPYEASSFGLTPSGIALKILGNAEAFAPPMALDSLLLSIHIHLFLYTISLLTVASIYFRLPISPNTQILMISFAYSMVLMNMLGLVLVRFVSSHFVWLKFLGFWGFQLVFGWMCLQSFLFLLSPKKKGSHHVSH